MPPVSVIMNVRNGASTLREALDSVMAQTFHDWELIVWDDRSTDDSAAIIAEYRDPQDPLLPVGRRHLAGQGQRQCHSPGERRVAGLPRSGRPLAARVNWKSRWRWRTIAPG